MWTDSIFQIISPNEPAPSRDNHHPLSSTYERPAKPSYYCNILWTANDSLNSYGFANNE